MARPDKNYHYQVRIPPKLWHGARIRVPNIGKYNPMTGIRGDLHMNVLFAKHKHFVASGANMTYDLNVKPWEIVLGTKVTILKLLLENF